MTGHLLGYVVYILAMIGIIFIGFIVVKYSNSIGSFSRQKNKFLNVESSLMLEPRKNIYVLKAGSERFLISTDLNGSHLLTKLDPNNIPEEMPAEITNTDDNFYIDTPVMNFLRNFSPNSDSKYFSGINNVIKKILAKFGCQKK